MAMLGAVMNVTRGVMRTGGSMSRSVGASVASSASAVQKQRRHVTTKGGGITREEPDLISLGTFLPYFAGALGLTGVLYYSIRHLKVFGGTVPSTLNQQWKTHTQHMNANKEREGSSVPVAMNPLRHGYPATLKGGTDTLQTPGQDAS